MANFDLWKSFEGWRPEDDQKLGDVPVVACFLLPPLRRDGIAESMDCRGRWRRRSTEVETVAEFFKQPDGRATGGGSRNLANGSEAGTRDGE